MQLFIAAFQGVPDQRAENVRHDLVDLLFIAFIDVLCGAQNGSEMLSAFGLCCRGNGTQASFVRRAPSIARRADALLPPLAAATLKDHHVFRLW